MFTITIVVEQFFLKKEIVLLGTISWHLICKWNSFKSGFSIIYVFCAIILSIICMECCKKVQRQLLTDTLIRETVTLWELRSFCVLFSFHFMCLAYSIIVKFWMIWTSVWARNYRYELWVKDRFRSSHHRCSIKKLFLKISQYSQENTCVGVSF